MSDGGKGSKARPLSVDTATFDSNWETIFAKKKPSNYQDILSTEDCVVDALDKVVKDKD
jgi:hypothetical protein